MENETFQKEIEKLKKEKLGIEEIEEQKVIQKPVQQTEKQDNQNKNKSKKNQQKVAQAEAKLEDPQLEKERLEKLQREADAKISAELLGGLPEEFRLDQSQSYSEVANQIAEKMKKGKKQYLHHFIKSLVRELGPLLSLDQLNEINLSIEAQINEHQKLEKGKTKIKKSGKATLKVGKVDQALKTKGNEYEDYDMEVEDKVADQYERLEEDFL